MFSLGTSRLTQRALATADLLRSFLLLEDDRSVDWEVDRSREREQAQVGRATLHEHRRSLVRPCRVRRPGEGPASQQVCLSPVAGTPAAPGRGVHEARGRLLSRGNSRLAERDGRPPCGRPSSY
jgi:hypothetical protein